MKNRVAQFQTTRHSFIKASSCLLALSMLSALPQHGSAAEHTQDSLKTVQKNLGAGKAILLDVRELAEWNRGHLKAARLAPLSAMRTSKSLKEISAKLPKDKVIYTHCKSGGRCLIAADLLEAEGFKVRALKPGYQQMLKAGFEKASD